MRHRSSRRALVGLALAVGGMLGLLAPATGLGQLEVIYSPDPAANAINDGVPGTPGLTLALRQAPVETNPRFPSERLMGKLSGRELAAQPSAEAMAALLIQNQRVSVTRAGATQVGGRVGVDEITPNHWSVASAGMLRQALQIMGEGANGVIFYASPALVEQVGRTDPRQALPARNSALVGALASGGHLYLEVYRGSLQPFPAREMANHLTRWRERWPAAREGFLHVLIGPGIGATQQVIWGRIRSTEAGRELLANGPGSFGLRSAQEGNDWLAQYRDFLARPGATPGGSARVIRGGGVRLSFAPSQRLRPGARFQLQLSRPSTAIVALVNQAGARRVFRKVTVQGAQTVTVQLPAQIRPGRYEVTVFVSGDGIKDRISRLVQIVGPVSPAR